MKKITALLLVVAMLLSCVGCTASSPEETIAPEEITIPAEFAEDLEGISIGYVSTEELLYADKFSIHYLEDDFILLCTYTADYLLANRILAVPEGGIIPSDLPSDILIVDTPTSNVMLASSPMMSLSNALGKVDAVKLTATATWYIDNVNDAIADGSMIDVGKYSTPDYELILANMPDFAIFSTMIEEISSTVSTQLTELGINFFCDRSPNEPEALGRTEWLKFLGVLYGEYDLACELFDKQVAIVDGIAENMESIADEDKKTVLFFYVISSGSIYVRNEDDYLSNAIAVAGGEGIFTTDGTPGSSSIIVTPEVFYTLGVDADVIIYNYSNGGYPESVQDIIDSRDLEILKDFKAYETGDIWATSRDFYQVTDTIGQVIGDIHTAIYDEDAGDELTYLNRLK
ncbi:MAG: ABC transporter substrate-binding protein [Bacillota bacterium]